MPRPVTDRQWWLLVDCLLLQSYMTDMMQNSPTDEMLAQWGWIRQPTDGSQPTNTAPTDKRTDGYGYCSPPLKATLEDVFLPPISPRRQGRCSERSRQEMGEVPRKWRRKQLQEPSTKLLQLHRISLYHSEVGWPHHWRTTTETVSVEKNCIVNWVAYPSRTNCFRSLLEWVVALATSDHEIVQTISTL